jgi:hypothetical protein
MTHFTEQQLDPLVDFAAQAIADAQTTIFKTRGYKYDDLSEESLTEKYDYLANYLNKCWKSLILRDDQKMINTFSRIHQHLSNESPICILKLILDISLNVMNDVPIIASSSKRNKRTAQNTNYVNTLNGMLKTIYKDILFINFQQIFKPSHDCPNPKLDILHITEDPEIPLFKRNL